MDLTVSDVSERLGITKEQAKALDALDGKGDDVVSDSVYNLAKAYLDSKSNGSAYSFDTKDEALHKKIVDILNPQTDIDEETKQPPTPPQNGVNNQLPNVQFSTPRPPKAMDFDYSNFNPIDRDDAVSKASEALDDAKKMIGKYNIKHPYVPILPDYSGFPDPKDYTAKQCGSKMKAFTEWKAEVERWKDGLEEMVENLEEVSDKDAKFTQIMNALCQLFVGQGLTRNYIEGVVREVGYENTQEINERLRAEASRIKGVTRQEGDKTRRTVVADGNLTRFQEAADTGDVLNKIEEDGVKTRTNIENNKQEEEEKANLRKEIGIAWNNRPAKLRRKVTEFLRNQGYRFDNDGYDADGKKAAAIETVIENMTLDELLQLRDMLKVNDDPLVH